MQTAEIVIIGGGAVGCSIAYHLAKAGVQDVLVLERLSELGHGSTNKAAAGFRHQFSTGINIALSREGVQSLKRLSQEGPQPLPFREHGYLLLASTAATWSSLQEAVALQRRFSVESRILTPTDARELVPGLGGEDLVGATFYEQDGICEPLPIVRRLARVARDHGVRFLCDTDVTGIETAAGRIAGVQTSQGRIATRSVVCAAGASSRQIGAFAGVTLPIEPRRATLWETADSALPAKLPFIIDVDSGLVAFRRENDNIAYGMPGQEIIRHPSEAEGPPCAALLPDVAAAAAVRLPALAAASPQGVLSGLYEMTPDAKPIIGFPDGLAGFLVVAGFSGHGVMHALPAGRIASELLTRGHTDGLDISSLAPQRFRVPIMAGEDMVF